MSDKRCVIVLDLGTSSFKCGIVGFNSSLLAVDTVKFKLSHEGMICETDFSFAFDRAIALLQKAFHAAMNKDYIVKDVLITSQAQTFVPVDGEFNPLSSGIVWLDARAEKEAEFLGEKNQDFSESAGLIRPLPELYATKLLWLKKNKPDVFKKACYFPLINEYVAWGLTGKFYSDYTNFGMGGVFDMRTKKISRHILNILGLSEDNFPEIRHSCGIAYSLKSEIAKRLRIKNDVKVYMCGNDQSASSIGSGVCKKGDVSVNFGTAMVTYALTDEPVNVKEPSQIAGIAPMGGYFFLSHEPQFGNIIARVKSELFPGISYDGFFSKYKEGSPALEPGQLNAGKIDFAGFDSPDTAAASVIGYFIERFQRHISAIEKYTAVEKVFISGGVARSKVWRDIIKSNCERDVISVKNQEAGLVGAYYIYRKNCKIEKNAHEKI